MKVTIKTSDTKRTTAEIWRDENSALVIGHNIARWPHLDDYAQTKCGYYYVSEIFTECSNPTQCTIADSLGIKFSDIIKMEGELTTPAKPGRPAAPPTPGNVFATSTPGNTKNASAAINPLTDYIANEVTNRVLGAITPKMEEIAENATPKPTTHIIKVNESAPVEIQGTLHPEFNAIVTMVKLGIMPYLYGPAGTGKSTIAEQVAKALNLEFYTISAVQDPSEIFGRTTADGKYIASPFYNAFVNGGLVLFDEIDGSLPDVLIKANQALANRVADFPIIGTVHAHPNFRLIATANTIGQGQSQQYNGRFAQDAALMNRFGALVYIGYDEQIELANAGGNAELVEFVHKLRELAEQKTVNLVITCREIRNITALINNAVSTADALRYTILNRIGKDDQQKLINSMPYNGNEFCEAFAQL